MVEVCIGHTGRIEKGEGDERHGRSESKVVSVDNLAPPDHKENSAQNRVTQVWQVQIGPGHIRAQCDATVANVDVGSGAFALNKTVNSAVVLKAELSQGAWITM